MTHDITTDHSRRGIMPAEALAARDSPVPGLPMLPALFAVTLFLGGFLLGWLPLIFGKLVLARLGGTPVVWNTITVAFVICGLLGPVCAYFLSMLTFKRQWVHCLAGVRWRLMCCGRRPSPWMRTFRRLVPMR